MGQPEKIHTRVIQVENEKVYHGEVTASAKVDTPEALGEELNFTPLFTLDHEILWTNCAYYIMIKLLHINKIPFIDNLSLFD